MAPYRDDKVAEQLREQAHADIGTTALLPRAAYAPKEGFKFVAGWKRIEGVVERIINKRRVEHDLLRQYLVELHDQLASFLIPVIVSDELSLPFDI